MKTTRTARGHRSQEFPKTLETRLAAFMENVAKGETYVFETAGGWRMCHPRSERAKQEARYGSTEHLIGIYCATSERTAAMLRWDLIEDLREAGVI